MLKISSWTGEGAIPPPLDSSIWLLPNQDTVAVRMAERQMELSHAGWRVIRVDPEKVDLLRNKARMIEHPGDFFSIFPQKLDDLDVWHNLFNEPKLNPVEIKDGGKAVWKGSECTGKTSLTQLYLSSTNWSLVYWKPCSK